MGEPANVMLDAIRAGDAERVRAAIATDPALAAARDENGVSAPLLALYHRQPQIAQVLLAARGAARLDVHEAAALGEIGRLRELLDADADEHLKWSADGFTPLHLACFFAREEAVDVLLEHGAAVTFPARNAMKVQPLHSAAAIGHVGICGKLLAHHPDVDAAQEGGFTPLMSAAHAGNLPLLELLLEHGASVKPRTMDGKTALDLAREGGHGEAVQRLQAAAS